MAELSLQEFESLQTIRDIPFPAGVRFRQIVVTGPPGCGKTTLINALGGWPGETFLDLTKRNWWRRRALTFRPREVHLGIPFRGVPNALAVIDQEWLSAAESLELELERIQVPPVRPAWFPLSWRHRHVFDFILPPSELVFERRRERSYRMSHPVDLEFRREDVERQLWTYRQVAQALHVAGLLVCVREQFDAAPRRFGPWEGF